MTLLILGKRFLFTDAEGVRVETIVTDADGSMTVEIANRCKKDVQLKIKPSDSVLIAHTHVPNEHDGSIVLDVLFNNTTNCQGRLSCMPANVCTFLQYDYSTAPTQATSTCMCTNFPTITMLLCRIL